MTNLEFYKDEILKRIETEKGYSSLHCTICRVKNKLNRGDCGNHICDIHDCIEWLCEEHKEPIKLKQWEYDLIRTNDMSHNRSFGSFNTYLSMKRCGYFSGIKDTSLTLKETLNNCIIVADDHKLLDREVE